MEYIRFGKTGLKVSKLCLGTWHLPPSNEKDSYGIYKVDEEESKKIIKKAIDYGINFFDTANVYHGVMQGPDVYHVGKAEKILGEAIKGYDRESLVISTKVYGKMALHPNGQGLSRKHVMWQVKESLKRLGIDYIDIYLMHRPDPETPIEETMETFYDLVRQGKVYYVGESYFDPEDIPYLVKLARDLKIPFVAMQEPYNFLERDIEKDKFLLAKTYGLGIMAYIPLAQGVLTGKYLSNIPDMSRATYVPEISNRYFTKENFEVLKEFHEVATELGVTDSQLALAWIFKVQEVNGVTIVPIIGVTKLNQLEDNIESVNIRLPEDVYRRLDEISKKSKVNWEIRYNKILRRES
ncbi:aldo/keto reductase [Sulfolobus tengchongensis]|uniref:Aldo/keto reductase n=1 Tax=Sulfolobus tengchongensis TaxID=207809 RepID=A0AAX4KXK1_9CREN